MSIKRGKLIYGDRCFDGIYVLKNGVAVVAKNDKFNYINKEGKFLSEDWFDYVHDFIDGFGIVELNGKYNYINEKGEYISKYWFYYAFSFENGVAIVKNEGKYNIINQNGEYIRKVWFDDWRVDNGSIKIKLNGEWKYLDKSK